VRGLRCFEVTARMQEPVTCPEGGDCLFKPRRGVIGQSPLYPPTTLTPKSSIAGSANEVVWE
jgi:hypothetical protein